MFPLVPGLLELQARGHTVHLQTGAECASALQGSGLSVIAEPAAGDVPGTGAAPSSLRHELARLIGRASSERASLETSIATVRPDALLVDSNAYGGAIAAERSGLPWAMTLPSLLPLPGRGIPPYGLGLRPWRGALGRVRDGLGWRLVERLYARALLPPLNAARMEAGLPPLRSPVSYLLAADVLLVLTGAPLEYPRVDLPKSVHFVGAQLWDPPAAPPAWLLEEGNPWVLVTCSTGYQHDERLAAAAVAAFKDEPVRVIVTLAGAKGFAGELDAPNARIVQFVPHGPLLPHLSAVVCHSGMGIVQKAVAAGVPIVAVPFARDQPEVARRVADCGAGVVLSPKNLTADRLRAAFHESIEGHDGSAAQRLRAAGGPARFAAAASELVSERAPSSLHPRDPQR